MPTLNQFKDEFRVKALDFASVYLLLNKGTKTKEEQERIIDESLKKFESFVLEQFNTWIIETPEKKITGEREYPDVEKNDDTISLDF